MSKQLLSIEQMNRLQEFCLDTSNASAGWYKPDGDTEYFHVFDIALPGKEELLGNEDCIPSYTLQDVLDLLPESITMGGEEYYLVVEKDAVMYVLWTGVAQMTKVFGKGKCINNPQALIDYAYEMLCWCIENGHVETSKQDKS